jgi:hypothetical protein
MLAIEEFDAELQLQALEPWWLTPPWVTHSSSAAHEKLSWRAAASKALSA